MSDTCYKMHTFKGIFKAYMLKKETTSLILYRKHKRNWNLKISYLKITYAQQAAKLLEKFYKKSVSFNNKKQLVLFYKERLKIIEILKSHTFVFKNSICPTGSEIIRQNSIINLSQLITRNNIQRKQQQH